MHLQKLISAVIGQHIDDGLTSLMTNFPEDLSKMILQYHNDDFKPDSLKRTKLINSGLSGNTKLVQDDSNQAKANNTIFKC